MEALSLRDKNMIYSYYIKEMLYIHSWKKRDILKILICTGTIFIIIIFPIFAHVTLNNQLIKASNYQTDMKYILIWEKFKGVNKLQSGQVEFMKQNCLHINCFLTHNRTFFHNDLTNFNAIVFDVHDTKLLENEILSLPRAIYQKYIFHSLESSDHHPVCNVKFDNFFNWTWTYKTNSDISHPRFDIFDIDNKRIGPKANIAWIQNMTHNVDVEKYATKTKAIAWISYKNKCSNKGIIEELRNELKGYNYSVDIFGPCGDKKCANRKLSECYKTIEKDYKFALVFEDTDTEDFVSDKLLRVLQHNTIPIVFGDVKYSR